MAKLLKMDSIGSYKKILSAVSSNVQTSINLGDSTTLRGLMGYSEALKNIKSYQLAGSDAMINGGSYQVASTEDILKVQTVLRRKLARREFLNLNLRLVWYSMILGLLAMFQMISLTLLEVMRLDHLRQQWWISKYLLWRYHLRQ